MTLTKYENQYGECIFCGYVGTMNYHHLIPKSMNIKTEKGISVFYQIEGTNNIIHNKLSNKLKIENLMIKICGNCHKKLHLEFKKYNSN